MDNKIIETDLSYLDNNLLTRIIEKISSNDIIELKCLLGQLKKEDVNFVDHQNDMTPLQYACYKKNTEIVQLLIDMGADVNYVSKHDYSSLHFAALSGSPEICLLLLNAGADPMKVNSVKRTPSQMAAFVGHHAVVATINNFIPKSDIECYVKCQGKQKEPYMKPYILDTFHKFIIESNVHPVRIALNLQTMATLLDNLKSMHTVLTLMVNHEMNRKSEINEVMAFKYHYLASIVNEIIKFKETCDLRKTTTNGDVDDGKVTSSDKKTTKKDGVDAKKKNPDEKLQTITSDKGSGGAATTADGQTNYIETFIKRILKENKSGELPNLEAFVRDSVREFPFRESTIFRQIVSQLVNKQSMSALEVIKTSINGQRGFTDEMTVCSTCGKENPDKKCSKCKEVQYCDRECQRLHWFMHKKSCARPTPSTTNGNGATTT